MKKRLIVGLLFLTLLPLSSCGEASGNDYSDVKDNIIKNLQKGFEVSGEVNDTIRYYIDSNYYALNDSKDPITKKYEFSFTFQNDDDYVGIDRNIYLIDGTPKRMIIDDNAYNNNGKASLNYLSYDNKLYQGDAVDTDDETGLNGLSYSALGLANPFLFMDKNDVNVVSENSFSFDNEKLSDLVLNMFSSISSSELAAPVVRNIFNLDENGDISNLIIYLDNTYQTKTNSEYVNEYLSSSYVINMNFSSVGKANAKDKCVPYEDKAENSALGEALRKIGSATNLKISRKDVTIYNDVEVDDSHQTIINWFDGEKIFYEVYDAAVTEAPTSLPDGQYFLLTKTDEMDYLMPYTYNETSNGWQLNSDFANAGGYAYKDYLPYISQISEDIFEYDAENDVYVVPEYLASYFISDACLISPLQITDYVYIYYTNSVEIKLTSSGDIEYVRMHVYFDNSTYIQTGYYELTYAIGDDARMPFGIDKGVTLL